MNHEEAVARECVRRYLLDRLADRELERFEDHLVGCLECQRQLEVDETMRAAFAAAQVGGAAKQRRRPSWVSMYAMAATVVIAVGAGWIVYSQIGSSGAVRGSRAGPSASIADMRVVRLVAYRSGESAAAAKLPDAGANGGWLLDVSVPRRCPEGSGLAVCADGRTPTLAAEAAYRLEIQRVSDGTVAYAAGMQPPLESGAVVFFVPRAALSRDRYRVVVSSARPVAEFVVEVP